MAQAQCATEVNSLDSVRPSPAKAGLRRQASSIALIALVREALIRHYGSLKAAAISLSMDPGQLTRELQTGDFKFEKLERADDEAKAFLAQAMQEVYVFDPRSQALRMLREARRAIDEAMEHIQ